MTLHHLEPRPLVCRKVYELLRPGGRLVICEANGWNLLLRLQFFLRRGFKTKIFLTDPEGRRVEYGNERITTPFALCRGLRRAGLRIDSVQSFRLLPSMSPPSWWVGVDAAILSIAPFLSTHYTVVATKPES